MGLGELRLRIVGGQWSGRTIRAPGGDRTRPTTDRVREALFSALVSRLGSDLGAGRVLDPFAGSGALGLEALSRGASSAVFVEDDRRALSALRDNVAALGAEQQARIIAGNVLSLPVSRLPFGPFSLILLDPPYTLDASKVAALLTRLGSDEQVSEGALVSWEHAAGPDATWPEGYARLVGKRYGSTGIDIAIYEGGAGPR